MSTEGISPTPPMQAPPGFDTTRSWVQVIERRPDGFVEFRFAIGDPQLFVELLLTDAAYQEFVSSSGAEVLPPVAETDVHHGHDSDDADEEWDWSLRDATHQRFR